MEQYRYALLRKIQELASVDTPIAKSTIIILMKLLGDVQQQIMREE